MRKESLLGSMKDRVKTDVRLPKRLVGSIEEITSALGVGKNAFFVLSAAVLAVEVLPLLEPGKRRLKLLAEIEDVFQTLITETRKRL